MFKMKEDAVTDCRGQKVNSKLVDNSHCIKPTNRTGLRLRENGALVAPASNGVSKDKKYRNKQTEPMKKINAFAKMELDIPEDTALTTKRPSTITSTTTSSRGGTKILGNETYSRVKRSLMGDFPRIHNPAQVHPRPMDGTDIVELRQLRTLVQELRDRESKLQSELMEFKDIREVANRVPILEKELGLRNEEAECLKRNVEDLEGEKCKMAEQLSHYPVLIKEVEEARAKIKEFQRHMLSESRQAEDILQQCINSTENKLKLLEVEVMELRRSNMELQHQKRDLATKLSSAETKVAALGKLTENDIVAKVQAEASKLRHTNENLCKQVEGLQMNRFSEVEELVYLRWVNSCLRYELRNSDVASGRASALDLKDTLSPKSQDIAKQLLLDYASSEQRSQSQRKLCTENDLESLSSYSSSITSEGEEHDETLADQLPSKFNMPKKSSLIGKLKKWTKTNDDWQVVQIDHVSEKGVENSKHQVITSPRRRHSISGPKESIQHLKPQSKQEFAFASKLNSVRASLEASNPKTQMEGLRRSFVTNCSLFEDNSDVGSSFQIISKTVSRDFDDKYPPFKHRHKLMVDQAAVVENAKKVAESGEKPEVAKHCESSISISTDDERSVLRIHKPPPKPSEVAAKNDEVPKLTSISAPAISAPAPPPPPPPPSIPSVKLQGKVNTGAHPPPPPPPPPRFVPASTNTMRRAPQVVEFYQSLMKRDIKKDSSGSGISNTANVSNALSSMIGEIENRSSHLLAIKADVEKQGDFVRSLIGEVKGATYSNIEDVLAFVKWLDDELAFLVDERAVLKHFDWPERKADAMREAAFGYRDLKNLETEISSYECNHHQPCSVALKKMVALLEKCEQKIYNILRTRESSMPRYKEFNIPTDWMLDTGIVSKVKLASVKLAKKYMERVTMELEALKCSEKEPEREFLLLQGVRFAFRVHQFAGGLDAESMQAFEELRNLAHRNHMKS